VIYIHVPFCRRACHYCDFHFSTNAKQMDALVQSLINEITLRNDYLIDRELRTIYFGGGTPSMLPVENITGILERIHSHFSVSPDAEVTLEANPEDLTRDKLLHLRQIGVNRLSLGTQSFLTHELQWMNRMHTPEQAIGAIKTAQDVGFDNISIDLIFGLPGQTLTEWERNLNTAIGLNIQHISSYGLTVEQRTKLHHDIEQGRQKEPDEDMAEQCLRINMEMLPAHGFEHYEISNYAKEGFISRHNSAYWQGKHYLGIGPSAHSYNGVSRQWNVRSNAGYMQAIASGGSFFELEELTVNNRVNEHIMIGLRSKWGVQHELLDPLDASAWDRINKAVPMLGEQYFEVTKERIMLSAEGRLIADRLAAELFQ
jgi:oxygen-independent coproporphyrinogen III oxidase